MPLAGVAVPHLDLHHGGRTAAAALAGIDRAFDGDTVVIGAKNDDDNGTNSGSAYVFERNQGGADNWGEVVKLTASGAPSS